MNEVILQNHRKKADDSTENIVCKNLLVSIDDTTKAPDVDDFEIIKPISRGSFGKVFLGCKKNNPEQIYAIKAMSKNDMINKNMASQVVTERNALALARSPYCVQLFYSLQTTSHVFLVMEYMVGGDLKTLLSAYGYFEESMAVFYAAEVTLALGYLHQHGIIHRDLKPDNMLISKDGHIKLTDFGLSRVSLHRDLEISDLVNCTPCVGIPNGFSRTPGQLLSLTSHLSFGSSQKIFSIYSDEPQNTPKTRVTSSFRSVLKDLTNFDNTNSKCTTSSRLTDKTAFSQPSTVMHCTTNNFFLTDISNDTGLSDIMPFVSIERSAYGNANKANDLTEIASGSSSSFHSCNSSICIDQNISNSMLGTMENVSESGFGGLDCSSPKSRSNFKRPSSLNLKRKRSLQLELSEHTNLTQEFTGINLVSNAAKRSNRCISPGFIKDLKYSPLKSSLKPQMSYDDDDDDDDDDDNEDDKEDEDDDCGLHLSRNEIAFSTPVSAKEKLKKKCSKTTRFDLPASEILRCEKDLLSPQEVINVSPIPSATQTPFRTPKSVRRGKVASDQRILGTPDYLAPELLLQQGHGFAVDWWALGVCLFEFMTGIPPFNDETPQAVFKNILSRDIPWPSEDEQLSQAAQEAIESLLTLDPGMRPSAEDVKLMPLFSNITWDNMENMEVPFVPQPDDVTDTYYFEARNKLLQLNVSNIDS